MREVTMRDLLFTGCGLSIGYCLRHLGGGGPGHPITLFVGVVGFYCSMTVLTSFAKWRRQREEAGGTWQALLDQIECLKFRAGSSFITHSAVFRSYYATPLVRSSFIAGYLSACSALKHLVILDREEAMR